jgi:hypothetical protein
LTMTLTPHSFHSKSIGIGRNETLNIIHAGHYAPAPGRAGDTISSNVSQTKTSTVSVIYVQTLSQENERPPPGNSCADDRQLHGRGTVISASAAHAPPTAPRAQGSLRIASTCRDSRGNVQALD